MSKKTGRIAKLVAGFMVTGLLGFAVGGFAGGAGGHGFGGVGMHFMMSRLVDDLNLNENQQQRLDTVHTIVQEHMAAGEEDRNNHHKMVLAQIESGTLDREEIRRHIDEHAVELTGLANQIADEIVPLINSLDDTQRTALLGFIEDVHAVKDQHGCGTSESKAHPGLGH